MYSSCFWDCVEGDWKDPFMVSSSLSSEAGEEGISVSAVIVERGVGLREMYSLMGFVRASKVLNTRL